MDKSLSSIGLAQPHTGVGRAVFLAYVQASVEPLDVAIRTGQYLASTAEQLTNTAPPGMTAPIPQPQQHQLSSPMAQAAAAPGHQTPGAQGGVGEAEPMPTSGRFQVTQVSPKKGQCVGLQLAPIGPNGQPCGEARWANAFDQVWSAVMHCQEGDWIQAEIPWKEPPALTKITKAQIVPMVQRMGGTDAAPTQQPPGHQ